MKEFFNYLDKLNALEDVPFDLDSQWESKPKNEGKRIVKKSAKLNENYGHDGYMYITKHGLGPGTLPKDAHLLKWKDLPHYMTAIWLDRFLTTDELKQYDIYPETQIRRVMDMYDITEDDIMGESVKAKRKTGSKALKEELSDIKQEWEDFLSRGGNNVIEFDDGDYVFFGVDFDKGTIYAGSATNTGIIREYEINLDSDLNLDENIAELYDEICREKEQVDESVKIKRKSNLKENKRLVEGPGAGYTIEGQLSDIQIHDFTFSVNDDIVTVNCNIDAISKDTEAHSYYYGDIIGKVPVTISKVQYYIYDDASSITEDAVREDLKYYLDGIKYEAIVGGGWSHTTFDGNITAKMFRHYNGEDSDVIYLEMDCTDEGDILYIDDVVTGEYEREDEEDYIEESIKSKRNVLKEAKRLEESVESVQELADFIDKRNAIVSKAWVDGDSVKVQGAWKKSSNSAHSCYVELSKVLTKKFGRDTFKITVDNLDSRDGGKEFSYKMTVTLKNKVAENTKNESLEDMRLNENIDDDIKYVTSHKGELLKRGRKYSLEYNEYVNANTNAPMGGCFTLYVPAGRYGKDRISFKDAATLKSYIRRHYFDESLEDNGLTKTTLKAIKKGTYFTFKPVEDPSENIVYVKDDYDRESRKYGYYKWSDTNNWHEKKGDTVVYTGFTF